MLLDALRNQPQYNIGGPTKKQVLAEGTPLKHFLRPIIEDAMKRKMMEMSQQQMPQMAEQQSPMVEPPSVNPLQNKMMSMDQGGTGGGITKPSQGGGMSAP